MAKLVVDRMRVVEESNESGSDDLYMITFVGRNPPQSSSIHSNGPGYIWGSVSTGYSTETDVIIDSQYNPSNLYLCALIEMDNGKDITAAEKASILEFARNEYTARFASGSASLDSMQTYVIAEMEKGIYENFDNDDLIGTHWITPLNSNGENKGYAYEGHGGYYKFKFQRKN